MVINVWPGPCPPPAGQETPLQGTAENFFPGLAPHRLPNFLCLHLSPGEAPASTDHDRQVDKLWVRGWKQC